MKSIKPLVTDELDAVNSSLSKFSINDESLDFALKSFLCGSSKRIRTILPSLYIKALKNKVSEDSIKIMTVGEVIHNSSLLHDDVIDNADSRRCETTICKNFSPYISILVGDYLLSYATKILYEINNKEIFDTFISATTEMCKAEIRQYSLRGKIPEINDYINICQGKTATLFESILSSCAIIEELDREKTLEFARNFGILFQLKNDSKKESVEQDLKNKIYTAKDILGIEKSKDLTDNYLQKVRKIISELPNNEYKKGLEDLLVLL